MSFFLSPCLCLSLSLRLEWRSHTTQLLQLCRTGMWQPRNLFTSHIHLTNRHTANKVSHSVCFFFPSSSPLCPSLQVLFPLQHYQPNDRPTCHVTLHLPSVHIPGTYQCGLYAKNSEALVLFPYLWIFHFPMLVEFELMEYMVAKPRAVSFRRGICSHSTFWGGKECNKMKTLNPGQLLIFPHLYLLTMCNPTVSIIELIWLIKC